MSKSINFSNFKGGLNTRKNVRTWDQTEASELLNVEFTQDGSIVKCKGYRNANTNVLNSGATIYGLYEFILSTGTSYLIAFVGNKVYVSANGITFTEVYSGVTPGYYWQGATFFDYAIFVNGVDQPLVFDGGQVYPATWWTEKDIPSQITVWKNRIWMSGSPTAPYYVWYSAAGTGAGVSFDPKPSDTGPFKGNPGGKIAINVNDGQQITGMSTFYNTLVVYKTKSIHQIVGDSAVGSGAANEFSVVVINQGKGCTAPRSIINIYNDQFFIDETGINNLSLAIGQNQVGNILAQSISTKVQDIVNNWNTEKIKNAFSIHYEAKKQVWFIFPSGSSSQNDKVLIFDYSDDEQKPWTLRSGFSNGCGIYYDGKPLLGGYDGYIQQHDTTDSYNGAAIEAYWGSSWLAFGNSLTSKHVTGMDITLELTGNHNINVDISWDYRDPSRSYTISQKPTNVSVWNTATWGSGKFSNKQVIQLRNLGGPFGWGKEFKIKFSNSNANEPFRILGFDLIYDGYDWQPKAKTS